MADEVNRFVFLLSHSWKLGSSSARNRIDENLIQNHYGCVKAIFDVQGSEYYLEFLLKLKNLFAGFLADFLSLSQQYRQLD